MATPTYDLLESVTLATAASSVTFSSIDQGYGDLILVMSGTTAAGSTPQCQVNSDTGSNYSYVMMYGNGSAAYSSAGTSGQFNLTSSIRPTVPALTQTSFMDYTATDKHKSILTRGGTATVHTDAHAVRWASTSAIISIRVFASQDFSTGGTFNLYGVAK